MRAIVAFLFTIGVAEVSGDVRICSTGCFPDDEFQDEVTTTEWNEFIDLLTIRTFANYSIPCEYSEGSAVISYHEDFIWDLRFQIYSERRDKTKNTLNDCYCDFSDCQSEELRQCLAEARVEMNREITTVLGNSISLEIRRRAELC